MSHTLTKAQINQLKVVLAAVGLDVRPMPEPREPKETKPKWGKSAVARRAFWHAHPSYMPKQIPSIPGLKFYRWLSGREIHEYHHSLGAIRPAPRTLLLTCNKRRQEARARLGIN